jgi:GxxExxY protein
VAKENEGEMDINELTYLINGAVFEVNRILGGGFLEKVYENALMLELQKAGLSADNQVPIIVKYKNHQVGDYLADIIVEQKVIIELKALEGLKPVHTAQILNYMKACEFQYGLLVNFAHPKATIKRFVL